ncbi:hypothetical protein UFOVP635_21 [uncultured Caudovirales phage]|uniref:Uncharacterized protein n=1 Tax=uncultured Caudovirales phage TaxID=2100421 RepID=A0A6J5NDY5_9CAUD|nr:hypothetical protein UFOVP635_21 [uncultured Caudovirales phage]
MAIDLSAYSSIQTNLFVSLDIPNYQVLTFSDYHKEFTLSGRNYTGLGQLLSVSDTSDNLRAIPEQLSLSISGIPIKNVTDILNYKVKGSNITILRAFFNPTTGVLINITGNPAGKFSGIINNFVISDDLEMGSDTGSMTLTLTATSVIEMLNNKISGRRTNPIDQRQYYPTEASFDRVSALAKTNFQFGAP